MTSSAEKRDPESASGPAERSAIRSNSSGSSAGELDLPTRFGRFTLFDKIGEGGMARIYLGRATTGLGAERVVVVKQILPMLSVSSEFSRLFIDEAKLSAKLTHGNIAQVIDLGREDETLYIAMEYVEGFDLRQLLKACSRTRLPLPVEFSLLIMIETLRALDYAHRKRDEDGQPLGIVHRDVSPSNVLVSFEGEVKLCDFGIARAFGTGGEVPAEAIQGKAGYMSPEAANGQSLDGRSDVFAVGIMLWELLAGRRLYRTDKQSAPTLEQAREALIPSLPERGLPQEDRLQAIAMKLLAKNRDHRYESAAAALRELEDYAAETGLLASQLRFGEWLMDHFGEEIIARRKERERIAKQRDLQSSPSNPAAASAPDHSSPRAASGSDPALEPFEPPPPSLEAMVRPSNPDANQDSDKGAYVFVALLVLAIAGAMAFYLTR